MRENQFVPALLIAATSTILAVGTRPAEAFNLGLFNVSNNGATNVAPQFNIDVVDQGSGNVQFTFTNSGSVAPASITAVYFGKGSLFSNLLQYVTLIDKDQGTGGNTNVDFSEGASPGNPQGGITWTSAFDADADSPSGFNKNGVDVGESLGITFKLINGATLSSLQQGFQQGDLAIAMHVQSIGGSGGYSDWFGTNPDLEPVPEPITLLGTGMALGFGGLFKREYDKKKKKEKLKT